MRPGHSDWRHRNGTGFVHGLRAMTLAGMSMLAMGQTAVTVKVDAGVRIGPFRPIYGYFGYDEPNYTYTTNGRKLIKELAALSAAPVYIRTHFLLASGDGTGRLKWGSTNAYAEDASGKPVYDWTVTDRIFGTYLEAGAKPFVEIGFMPEPLSTHPEPYIGEWQPGAKNEHYSVGWTYPPKDYSKWGELVHEWVSHCVKKYGREEVASWYWEVWNEPDISYWHGTPEEYDKLYDYAADGVKRALPEARVGGPATTGGGSKFLRQFLEHCANGQNAVSGQVGAPLDFISYHAKGRPTVVNGHVRMGMGNQIGDVNHGVEVIKLFPKFQGLPIVLSESDPEGCAACSARVYPQNAYRNGALYACYTAAMMKHLLTVARQEKVNLAGALTWAFEFEDQPYFDGFRTLATHGIDKAVLNVFRMMGLMRGDIVESGIEAGQGEPTPAADRAPEDAEVGNLAVATEHEVTVLVWNYKADDVEGEEDAQRGTRTTLEIDHLPQADGRALVHHYRIDETHSNSWTAWKRMGSPQNPTPRQYAELEEAGQLQELGSPEWVNVSGGRLSVTFALPVEGVSLIQIRW